MEKRIKEVRKAARLTQSEFGEKLGVKGNTVANYESGLRVPLDAIITAICREFGINEQWLRDGTGEMKAETPEAYIDKLCVEQNLTPSAKLLLQAVANAFSALDEDTASECVTRMLNTLAASKAEDYDSDAEKIRQHIKALNELIADREAE